MRSTDPAALVLPPFPNDFSHGRDDLFRASGGALWRDTDQVLLDRRASGCMAPRCRAGGTHAHVGSQPLTLSI